MGATIHARAFNKQLIRLELYRTGTITPLRGTSTKSVEPRTSAPSPGAIPGGVERQAELLRAEGLRVSPLRKELAVYDFEARRPDRNIEEA